MKLHELYKNILTAAGLEVGTDWLVSYRQSDYLKPIEAMGKRLAVPAPQLLRKGPETWADLIAFHPLSESVIYGESEVLGQFRKIITFRASSVFLELYSEILDIAVNPKRQKKLPPACLEVLSTLSSIDERTVTSALSVLRKVGSNDAVSFYVRKGGGSHQGQKWNRLCRVASTFREELSSEGNEVYGVKLRQRPVREKEQLLALFDYILPMGEGLTGFNYGSNSQVAPNFHALIHSFISVATALNKITTLFAIEIPDHESLLIDLSWAPKVNNLDIYEGVIEPMEGNIGRGGKVNETANEPVRPVMDTEALNASTQRRAPEPNIPTYNHTNEVVVEERPTTQKAKEGIVSLKDLNLGGFPGNAYGPTGISPNGQPVGPGYGNYAPGTYPAVVQAPAPTYIPQPVPQPYAAPPQPRRPSAKEAYGGSFSVGDANATSAVDNRLPVQQPMYNYNNPYPPGAINQFQPQYQPQQNNVVRGTDNQLYQVVPDGMGGVRHIPLQNQAPYPPQNSPYPPGTAGAYPPQQAYQQPQQQPPIVQGTDGNYYYQITDPYGQVRLQPMQQQQMHQQPSPRQSSGGYYR